MPFFSGSFVVDEGVAALARPKAAMSGGMALGLTTGYPLIPRAYRGRPHSDFEFLTIPPFNFVYFS